MMPQHDTSSAEVPQHKPAGRVRTQRESLEGNETVPVRAADVVTFGKVPLHMLNARGLFELLSSVSGRGAPGSRFAAGSRP